MRRLLLFLALGLAEPATAEQFSQACRVACRVGQANPAPAQRQCLAQCMAGQPITRSAPGQARPSGGAVAPTPTAAPRSRPAPPSGPAAARGAPPTPGPTHGAVYLATPPNMGYGMAVGQRDRNAAHRLAEAACRASGASCGMAQESTLPCAAVVEGVRRAPGAFFMTSDPKTYRVRAITYAMAANPADAERDAREACAQRERGALTCRIVQAQCGPR